MTTRYIIMLDSSPPFPYNIPNELSRSSGALGLGRLINPPPLDPHPRGRISDPCKGLLYVVYISPVITDAGYGPQGIKKSFLIANQSIRKP